MKLKSSSSAKKRFRATGSGKIVGRKACRGHLLLQKSSSQKKLADKPFVLEKANLRMVKKLLPSL